LFCYIQIGGKNYEISMVSGIGIIKTLFKAERSISAVVK